MYIGRKRSLKVAETRLSNSLARPTLETARHVSCCVRGGRGTPTRWAQEEDHGNDL